MSAIGCVHAPFPQNPPFPEENVSDPAARRSIVETHDTATHARLPNEHLQPWAGFPTDADVHHPIRTIEICTSAMIMTLICSDWALPIVLPFNMISYPPYIGHSDMQDTLSYMTFSIAMRSFCHSKCKLKGIVKRLNGTGIVGA